MRLTLLALDYDGTIAERDQLNEEVRRALAKVSSTDVLLVLVTGRILADLQRVSGGLEAFDAVVAENGAVLYFPDSDRQILLADPLEPALARELTRRKIPFVAGTCILELEAKYAQAVLSVIHDLELPRILVFNQARLMVLPEAVSKRTGLRAAARVLRVSLHNAVAVGNGENDHELLRACEIGVAVAWGSPALQQAADEVLQGTGPAAVAKFIDRVTTQPTFSVGQEKRPPLYLGLRPDGAPLAFAPRGRNMLIVGDRHSGKSWLAGLLCEQLMLQHYSLCVIDPEGDYVTLERLPGVIVVNEEEGRPSVNQIEQVLCYPDISLVVNLLRIPHDEKHLFVVALLERIGELRRRTGLPHRLVIDEAQFVLGDLGNRELLDLGAGGHLLVSHHRAAELGSDVLASTEAVLVTGCSEASEAEALRKLVGGAPSAKDWSAALCDLEIDEAALLPGAEESGGEIVRFRLASRVTPHVRHKARPFETASSDETAFVFVHNGVPTGQRARSLKDLLLMLSAAPEHTFDSHLEHGDFSRWLQDVFADSELATEIRSIETAWRAGHRDRPCARIARVIRNCYLARQAGLGAASGEAPGSKR